MMLRCKDLLWDPSLFGDSGFFTPISATHNYIQTASKFRPPIKVFLSITDDNDEEIENQSRMQLARHRPVVQQEIDQVAI